MKEVVPSWRVAWLAPIPDGKFVSNGSSGAGELEGGWGGEGDEE
jgi:hypothetical protein